MAHEFKPTEFHATTEGKRGKLSLPLPALVTRLTKLDILLILSRFLIDEIIGF